MSGVTVLGDASCEVYVYSYPLLVDDEMDEMVILVSTATLGDICC